jgi:formiminotetrahydrofolate cyclodeaminase
VLDKTATIEKFLDAAAAKQPTPGGGSVSALAGALAASMGEMVLNYSIGKKGLEAQQEKLKAALAEFTRARGMMLELMVEDQAAFDELSGARKSQDAKKIAAAVTICVNVPLTMAATALAVIELAESLVGGVNKYLLSDLAVCAELAMATVRCALYNVRVNLPEISDSTQKKRIEQEEARLLNLGVEAMKRVIPAIWDRAKGGS